MQTPRKHSRIQGRFHDIGRAEPLQRNPEEGWAARGLPRGCFCWGVGGWRPAIKDRLFVARALGTHPLCSSSFSPCRPGVAGVTSLSPDLGPLPFPPHQARAWLPAQLPACADGAETAWNRSGCPSLSHPPLAPLEDSGLVPSLSPGPLQGGMRELSWLPCAVCIAGTRGPPCHSRLEVRVRL